MQNVSDASVGSSALSRIRAIQSAAASDDAAQQSLAVLWNVCFWSAIVIGGFAVAHLAVLLMLRAAKVRPRGQGLAQGRGLLRALTCARVRCYEWGGPER